MRNGAATKPMRMNTTPNVMPMIGASIRQINSPITPPMIVENTVLDRASVLFVIMNVFLRSIDAVDETSVMSSMVSLGCNCLCSPMNMFPDQIPR